MSPRFKKDVGRPALCWTLGGTTPPESGRWGPWYHLVEAFGSETAGCENFRGLCTNRESEPQSSKGLNTEKVLGDIVPPPRSLPLPPILSLQLFLWVPAWVPSALPSSSFAGILAHAGLHPSPRTSVIASSQVPLDPPPLYSQGDLPRSQVRPLCFPPKGHHGISPMRPLQWGPLPHSPPSPSCH